MNLNKVESNLMKFNNYFVGSVFTQLSRVIHDICLGIFAAKGTPLVFEARLAKSAKRLSTANVDTDLARSHKSHAAVDYTPIGVEPHGPT